MSVNRPNLRDQVPFVQNMPLNRRITVHSGYLLATNAIWYF